MSSLDASGKLQWQRHLGPTVKNQAALYDDGSVVIACGPVMYCLSSTGKDVWTFVASGAQQQAGPLARKFEACARRQHRVIARD